MTNCYTYYEPRVVTLCKLKVIHVNQIILTIYQQTRINEWILVGISHLTVPLQRNFGFIQFYAQTYLNAVHKCIGWW